MMMFMPMPSPGCNVVGVPVIVGEWLVGVLMFVAFGEVEPDADSHQQACGQ